MSLVKAAKSVVDGLDRMRLDLPGFSDEHLLAVAEAIHRGTPPPPKTEQGPPKVADVIEQVLLEVGEETIRKADDPRLSLESRILDAIDFLTLGGQPAFAKDIAKEAGSTIPVVVGCLKKLHNQNAVKIVDKLRNGTALWALPSFEAAG